MPVRPPSDIHLVCADHPEVADLNSWTSIYEHCTTAHPTGSPDFAVVATGYPAE